MSLVIHSHKAFTYCVHRREKQPLLAQAGGEGGQEGGHEGGEEGEAVIYCVHRREKQPLGCFDSRV